MTIKVRNTAELRQALAAGHAPEAFEMCNAEAVAAAHAEGVAAGKAEAAKSAPDTTAIKAEAAKAERARIAAIDAVSRPGFEALRTAAIEAGDSPEKFALAVLTEAGSRGITIEAIRKDSAKAADHAKPEDKDTDKPVAKSWDDIQKAAPAARM